MHDGKAVAGAAILINCQVAITRGDAQARTPMHDLAHRSDDAAPLVILGGRQKLLLIDAGGGPAFR
jgi:hypothetical protein